MTSRDKKPVKPSSSRGAGGIRTLSDLNRRSGPDSESDSDEPAEYYTGGEKSGMLVQDPTKGGNGNNDLEIETVEQKKKNRKRSRKKKSKPEEQKPKTPAITETEIGSPSKHPKKKKGKEKEKKKSHEEDEEEVVSDYYVKMCPHMFVPRGMEEAHTLEMTKFYTSHEFMSQCKDPFYDSSDIESLSDILKYMDIVSDTDDHDTDGGKMDANYYYGKPRSKRIEALESK